MYGKAAPQWCVRSSSVTQSATCKFCPHGPLTFVLTRPLRRLQRSWQPPPAELVGCVSQSRGEVKAWVRSIARVLLCSCTGFYTWADVEHLVDDIFWTLWCRSGEQCDKVHSLADPWWFCSVEVCWLSSTAGTLCYSIGHIRTVACQYCTDHRCAARF